MPDLEAQRAVGLTSPLGEDVLLFRRMTGKEQIGRPFEFELELLSTDHDIGLEDLLGKSLSVRLDLPEGRERYFDGRVSRFAYVGSTGEHAVYRASVKPWLWLLSKAADCRIFQNETVPDIVKKVFRARGLTDFDEQLNRSYRTWEYCVQYRETDFDFVSRLLEQEGIYYFFRHEKGKHTLVLADSYDSHESTAGYESLPYLPPHGMHGEEREYVDQWLVAKEVQPGAYALSDFDFTRPRAGLGVTSSVESQQESSPLEIFDYPGEYRETADGDAYVRARLEELQADHERAQGRTNARGLAAGALVELAEFPREDQNREYLVVSAATEVTSNEFESEQPGAPEVVFDCRFAAIPSRQPYRSRCVTPVPIVQGPQTAIVVGPDNQEIWTDEYGRVKVHFHWDRHSKSDENSSCWIRVSQSWAGNQWGTQFVPRIGQEVIVEFLEGDPDRPIITGQVYNAVCRPPYPPDQNATMSTIKTLSSKGGGGFNEIRFEDKKDEEQLFVHAQKNLDLRVKNDRFETVGRNRHLHIEQDKFEHVENNRHEEVDADHREEIRKDRHLEVEGKEAKKVRKSLSLTVDGDVSEVFKSDHSEETSSDYYLKARNVVIEGLSNVTVRVGESYLAIESGGIKLGTLGTIELDAKNTVDINSVMGTTVASEVRATLDSLNTTVKGDAMVRVSGGAMTDIRGGLVKIN